MINFFTSNILKFFDFFHKQKIVKKLKKINIQNNYDVVIDVGGHRGESLKLFLENFEVKEIYSFEPSIVSFKFLYKTSENLKKKFSNTNIFLENLAIGSSNKNVYLNSLKETSSSTIRNLNIESKYFKKKEKYFGKLINEKIIVNQINFEDYLKKKDIKKIDLLKIDTEGYEFEVLKGMNFSLSKVSVVLFEHHYDNMIIKDYTISDIHNLLKKYNFQKAYKIKMPFRKSFDYIYVNEKKI